MYKNSIIRRCLLAMCYVQTCLCCLILGIWQSETTNACDSWFCWCLCVIICFIVTVYSLSYGYVMSTKLPENVTKLSHSSSYIFLQSRLLSHSSASLYPALPWFVNTACIIATSIVHSKLGYSNSLYNKLPTINSPADPELSCSYCR